MVESVTTGRGTLIGHGREGWLTVTGPERKSWLQGIATADVMNATSRAFWGLLLDRTGKIRHEVIGIEYGESLRLCSRGQGLDNLYQYLDSMLVMEDVELERAPDGSLWSLHGYEPRSPLVPLGTEGSELDRPFNSGSSSTIAVGRLSWLTRSDWVFAVSEADEADWLASMSRIGLVPAEQGQWDWMRVAAGVPAWGVDYSVQDTPHHAGLFGRAVALNKGCYIGQEVVCKVEMRGHVSQRTARLVLDSGDGVAPGLPVTLSETGETVGTITSVATRAGELGAFALARVKTAALGSNPDLRVGTVRGRLADIDSAGP